MANKKKKYSVKKDFRLPKEKKYTPDRKGLPKPRKFGGRTFKSDNIFTRKGDAQANASRLRRAGYLARVTKSTKKGGGWIVFRRKK